MKTLIMAIAVLSFTSATYAQNIQYTRCINGHGEVVIVTNWTCPAGFWPV
jgi:hypothetical protein